MENYSEFYDNLSDEQIAAAIAIGTNLVACTIVDLQKEYGSAPVFPTITRLACVDEMWNSARFWSARANGELNNKNYFGGYCFLKARMHMRFAIMQMRETGEWYETPPTA